MAQDLKSKTINGLKWSVIDNIANSGIIFLVGLVLARILSPSEFGIIGIITIFINICNIVIDGGFITALIRKPDVDVKDYNTVFYSNLAISILLMIILLISAHPIANFFNVEELGIIIPIMSFVLLFNALSLIHKTILIIKIDFKTQAIVSLITSIVSGTIGILLALLGFGVWSLVIQQLSRQFLFMILLWITSKWTPSLLFSIDRFKDLFNFGSKVLLSNLINSIYKDAFLIVIGKIYTPSDLGQYNRAEQFNYILSNNLTLVVQKVTLPVLSKIQTEKERFTHAFKTIISYISIFTFSAVLGLAAVSKSLLIVLVGEQWIPASEYLQIMCLYGAIYPLQVMNANLLNIYKRSDLLLRLEIIKKVLFTVVILIGFLHNIKLMLWSAVIYYYIEFFFNSWFSEKLINFGSYKQILHLLPYFVISMCVSGVVYCMSFLDLTPLITLLLQLFICVILYIIIYEVIKDEYYLNIKRFVINKIKSISK